VSSGLFCPFAHRANLIRHLKGLTDIIDISIVKPYPKGDDKGWPGWKFPTEDDPYEGATADQLFGSKYMHEIYFKEKKDYEGRYSVPVLWDKKTNQLVNNESLEILRNFNTGFNSILPAEYSKVDFYPEELRKEIDEVGAWMQPDLNTGVYKAGFAPDQATYDKNVVPVFKALNRLEELLWKNVGPYVLGSELTELDLRLYPTLIRFDTVYVQHFKCNLGTIRHNYPLLNEWLKNLYWNVPGFKETTDFRHIKENVSSNSGSHSWHLLMLSLVHQKSSKSEPARCHSDGPDTKCREWGCEGLEQGQERWGGIAVLENNNPMRMI
jgi:putative glutathione S-transferase